MDTDGDNVICKMNNMILGDIMGYDGYFCSKCIARAECSKNAQCYDCKFNDICTKYDITPTLAELYIL